MLIITLLSGCAASSVDTAVKKGATPLAAEAIFTLVNGNTLHLVSSGVDAHAFHSSDGTVTVSSATTANHDSGTWDIKSDDKFCIKFDVWFHGDVNCYSVYKEEGRDSYLLFTDNGALAYTAVASTGNSQHIKVNTKKGKGATFVRGNMGQEQETAPPHSAPAQPKPPVKTAGPGASSKEIGYTVKNMAKDCPGCNLKGADLRKASLIGANLKGADLSGADLSRANLRRANLEGADLTGATLLSCNLPGANLKDADLSGADLTGSNLIQADLTDATLTNTILENTLQEGVKGLKE